MKNRNKIALYEVLGLTALFTVGSILTTINWHTPGGLITVLGLTLLWVKEIPKINNSPYVKWDL